MGFLFLEKMVTSKESMVEYINKISCFKGQKS